MRHVYLEHWGLREKQFENNGNSRFFYSTNGDAEALSRLTYGASERKPLVLLSGDYGTGKTMICNALFSNLPSQRFKIIHVANPMLPFIDILGEMLRPILETVSLPDSKGELLRLLREVLIRNLTIGKHNIVIIDEAHLIEEPAFFDELRMFLNYQHKQQPLLTLIFAGQSDLRDKISRLPALRQRISIQCHLKSMQDSDVNAYVTHRLTTAGCAASDAIFASTLSAIHAHSKGIPRIINTVCDLALLSGFQAGAKSISPEIIADVLKEVPSYEEAHSSF